MSQRGELKVFACEGGIGFAEDIITALYKKKGFGITLSQSETQVFEDASINYKLGESVRGVDAYVVQNCFNPYDSRFSINDNLFELYSAIDALNGSGASNVTAVLPFHPYSKKTKTRGRESLSMRMIANQLTDVGADNVLTMNLPSDVTEGFYTPKNCKLDNLSFAFELVPYLKRELGNGELAVITSNPRSYITAQYYANHLGVQPLAVHKLKSYGDLNEYEQEGGLNIIGDFKEKKVLIVENSIDSGNDVIEVAEKLKLNGALEVIVACVHPTFTKEGIINLQNSGLEVISSNSVYRGKVFYENNPWLKEINVAGIFAEAIYQLNHDESLSKLYEV